MFSGELEEGVESFLHRDSKCHAEAFTHNFPPLCGKSHRQPPLSRSGRSPHNPPPACGGSPTNSPPTKWEGSLANSPPACGRGLRGGQEKHHLLFPVKYALSAPSLILPQTSSRFGGGALYLPSSLPRCGERFEEGPSPLRGRGLYYIASEEALLHPFVCGRRRLSITVHQWCFIHCPTHL